MALLARIALPLAIAALSSCHRTHAADSSPLPEYQLKAAFLFHFGQFVEWPQDSFPNPESPFILAVIGDIPFRTELEEVLKDQEIQGRPIQLQFLKPHETFPSCHVAFLSHSVQRQTDSILRRLKGRHVLVVGDEIPQFLNRGGIINFVVHNNKLRFAIDPQAALDEELTISSKLLRLAINL